MTIRSLAVLASLVLALPLAAQAETVTLKAMQGATVHHATVDMSVYWTTVEGAFEVTAIYAAKGDASDTGRLVMALNDGDKVSFGVPGHVGQVFSFGREGDVMTLATATTVAPQLAMN